MNDLISRQAAIDIERNATVDTNPSHFEAHQKFTQFMDDVEISSFGRWQWSNGFNTALTAVGIDLKKLPSAQPEQRWIPCSERLPETHKAGNSVSGIFMKSKPVLVYGVPEYESEYSFNVVIYCDDLNGNTYWSTEMDAVTINEVTAWMPLPEPYKERREE